MNKGGLETQLGLTRKALAASINGMAFGLGGVFAFFLEPDVDVRAAFVAVDENDLDVEVEVMDEAMTDA
jgi:hypothetical protein